MFSLSIFQTSKKVDRQLVLVGWTNKYWLLIMVEWSCHSSINSFPCAEAILMVEDKNTWRKTKLWRCSSSLPIYFMANWLTYEYHMPKPSVPKEGTAKAEQENTIENKFTLKKRWIEENRTMDQSHMGFSVFFLLKIFFIRISVSSYLFWDPQFMVLRF